MVSTTMKLNELSKQKLVALAIQFKAFSSVTEAAAKSTQELSAELEKIDECVSAVAGLGS